MIWLVLCVWLMLLYTAMVCCFVIWVFLVAFCEFLLFFVVCACCFVFLFSCCCGWFLVFHYFFWGFVLLVVFCCRGRFWFVSWLCKLPQADAGCKCMLAVRCVFGAVCPPQIIPLVFLWGLFWAPFLFLGVNSVYLTTGKGLERHSSAGVGFFGFTACIGLS